MPDREDLKRGACDAIDRRKSQIIEISRDILDHPETGFNERRTAQLVAKAFGDLEVPHRTGLAITGVKGAIQGAAGPGPRVAIIGELDSLVVDQHPKAHPDTGAAHACGHNAQIGMMLGAVIGLSDQRVLPHLSGSVVPFAVPAEEFVEVEDRLALREAGKLEFLGGKQELIRLGEFDDVDMAMMCHTASEMGDRMFSVGGSSNGHMVKFVEYAGRGAHRRLGAPPGEQTPSTPPTWPSPRSTPTGRFSKKRRPSGSTASSPAGERRSTPCPPTYGSSGGSGRRRRRTWPRTTDSRTGPSRRGPWPWGQR